MRVILSLILTFLFSSDSFSQAHVIKLEQLEELMYKKNDTTYVINFWATWCKPCVEELPYFTEAESDSKSNKVKFYFISLDFKKDLSRLNAFLNNKKISSDVFLLDEPDYNKWIDKIDSSWQGNIPATLIYNHSKSFRKFYPEEFERNALRKVLQLE
jgi:thiol-disulfide isomerase/thioredoxin